MPSTTPRINTPVEMISVCAVDGELKPLRFRYEDNQHLLHTVKVEEIVAAKELNYVGTQTFQYVCRACTGPAERLFELRYTVKTHTWVLFRIIN